MQLTVKKSVAIKSVEYKHRFLVCKYLDLLILLLYLTLAAWMVLAEDGLHVDMLNVAFCV